MLLSALVAVAYLPCNGFTNKVRNAISCGSFKPSWSDVDALQLLLEIRKENKQLALLLTDKMKNESNRRHPTTSRYELL